MQKLFCWPEANSLQLIFELTVLVCGCSFGLFLFWRGRNLLQDLPKAKLKKKKQIQDQIGRNLMLERSFVCYRYSLHVARLSDNHMVHIKECSQTPTILPPTCILIFFFVESSVISGKTALNQWMDVSEQVRNGI